MILHHLLPQSACGRWVASTLLALWAACMHLPLRAQDAPAASAASPYFVVRGATPGVEALPLERTEVDVQVSGVIAEVRVVQHYRNRAAQPIEADYVFPGSTRAAVGGLTVRLADRVIHAEIREKQQARIVYDQARQAGQTAALLEQHRPNVFQMRVANILPGDAVQVELRYTELLAAQDGRYQFVFPTVVGPRYVGQQPADGADGSAGTPAWTSQPTLRQGEAPPSAFSLQARIDAPLPVRDIRSRSHNIEVEQGQDQPHHALVRLASGQGPANDRDFVLDYGLAGEQLAAGLMLAPGVGPGGENYFLAMVQPPQAVAASDIVPREYLFVVDVSGSMHGFPLTTAKAMLERLIGGLRPSDRFNVLLFSGSQRMLAQQSQPATAANIRRALDVLSKTHGGGSTELIPALRRVYAQPKPAGVARTVVVLTDGYVDVEQDAFALVRRHRDQANLFAFGIGSSVNRALIEGLARAGGSEPFVATDAVQTAEQSARFRRMVEAPVLTDVWLQFEGLEVYDVEPAVQPDVLSERPVVVFGKWRGAPQGRLLVQGRNAAGPWQQAVTVAPADGTQGAALPALWARERIAQLSDQEALEGGGAQRAAITQLALAHSLLTRYTSFVAVDQRVRTPQAAGGRQVRQPLPLPQGVSELALREEQAAEVHGVAVPSTPEPASMGAALVALSMLAMLMRRARRQRTQRWTA